jgi:hypothetical protein
MTYRADREPMTGLLLDEHNQLGVRARIATAQQEFSAAIAPSNSAVRSHADYLQYDVTIRVSGTAKQAQAKTSA